MGDIISDIQTDNSNRHLIYPITSPERTPKDKPKNPDIEQQKQIQECFDYDVTSPTYTCKVVPFKPIYTNERTFTKDTNPEIIDFRL
ncbi:MAG TPA: hypothetical protein DEP72_01290 [Clostridiales bacterium]|nr:MAG: hypothetical protein A2Y18_05695 [Clostridiales bacterium GWD2_32_19]HCC06787.1 hypothetical protein [Clostridiales bacterium]